MRVQSGVIVRVVVRVVTLVRILNVFVTTFPCSVSSKCAFVIDAPGENLVVMSESNAVHTAHCDLNNTDLVRG